jgi:hypothetical protein
MSSSIVSRLGRQTIPAILKTCGLCMVFAATCAIAQAAPPLPPAPEIDPNAISSALAFLAGGAFLFKGWCRKK